MVDGTKKIDYWRQMVSVLRCHTGTTRVLDQEYNVQSKSSRCGRYYLPQHKQEESRSHPDARKDDIVITGIFFHLFKKENNIIYM